jgi:hypothetical protein
MTRRKLTDQELLDYSEEHLGYLDEPPRYRESNTARTLADNLIDRWEWTNSL